MGQGGRRIEQPCLRLLEDLRGHGPGTTEVGASAPDPLESREHFGDGPFQLRRQAR